MKVHLLPRIFQRLKIKQDSLGPGATSAGNLAQNWVIVKNDRIFQHKLARFYYTTYDVQQAEDIINPRTSHCNVMLLADLETNSLATHPEATLVHPFLYGRVIGIYHANIIYVGPGMKDYEPMRFDFLYIRWFQLDIFDFQDGECFDWASLRLNRVSFPSMTQSDSFGFVDPSLVLRGCHMIPAFSFGKRHPSGTGFSSMSKDGNDWKNYYVNRSELSYWFSCCLC